MKVFILMRYEGIGDAEIEGVFSSMNALHEYRASLEEPMFGWRIEEWAVLGEQTSNTN